jgi:hypothetical protein
MKSILTFTLLLFLTTVTAQRVIYSPPETGYKTFANYDIIGRIGDHILIYINGAEGAEIAVFDNAMRKVDRIPADFLKTTASRTDFFAYPDHFFIFFQYRLDTTSYCSVLRGDANGHVLEGPIVLDSVPLPNMTSRKAKAADSPPILNHPTHVVIRSEDKQWFMLLKAEGVENGGYLMTTQLFDKELHQVEGSIFLYQPPSNVGDFSEFILDNDGDLAFLRSGQDGEDERINQVSLLCKPKGIDSLYIREMAKGGPELDDVKIRADNVNKRYILTSFYYAPGSHNLTGLGNMVWDKKRHALATKEFQPLPDPIRLEARSDYSSPDQILNYFYLRQVFPRKDGGFVVLAEMYYGPDRYAGYNPTRKRYDFIQGPVTYILAPPGAALNYVTKDRPGNWFTLAKTQMFRSASSMFNTNTGNVLVFFMDSDGKTRDIKVIKKAEYSGGVPHPLSYQAFIDGKAIHLIYNENVRGRYLPAGTAILADGKLEPDPILHDLDKDHTFLPRYAKQLGPSTIIVPCHDKYYLCFALVEY